MNAAVDPLAPYRGKLCGLAYRMLASRADAEDVLQDAYLRFRNCRGVKNPEAFLTTTVTQLCLDRLKSARARREIYVGPWLPDPVFDAEALSPHAATELADDLSFALMLALDRLSPAERAAFLLHDIFDMTFPDIAAALDKSEVTCRQLASRARKAVRAARPAPPVRSEAHARLLTAFLTALGSGDVSSLTAILSEDAIMMSDGGGRKMTALNPIRGADNIARFFIGAARKFGGNFLNRSFEFRAVNGLPGVLTYFERRLDQIMTIAVEKERVSAIYIVSNPEKLAGCHPKAEL